jgi:hypothetical protein
MDDDLEFLKEFPKDANDMYIVYDLFTFDNFFLLLLANDFGHEDAFYFMLANCSMNAYVFQERLHNKNYRKLNAKNALPADEAARRANVIYDIILIAKGHE